MRHKYKRWRRQVLPFCILFFLLFFGNFPEALLLAREKVHFPCALSLLLSLPSSAVLCVHPWGLCLCDDDVRARRVAHPVDIQLKKVSCVLGWPYFPKNRRKETLPLPLAVTGPAHPQLPNCQTFAIFAWTRPLCWPHKKPGLFFPLSLCPPYLLCVFDFLFFHFFFFFFSTLSLSSSTPFASFSSSLPLCLSLSLPHSLSLASSRLFRQVNNDGLLQQQRLIATTGLRLTSHDQSLHQASQLHLLAL